MTPETKWLRVSRELPCPVCGRFDWCLIAADKTAGICPRTESSKQCGEAGYLHRLVEKPRPWEPRRVVIRPRPTPPDLTALALSYQNTATADRVRTFASFLGVRTESMVAFGVGWAADSRAWSFPMRDPETGNVTGIRLRRPDGAKFSVTGGKESLFQPDTMTNDNEVLLVLEGASDAIAAHSIGFLNAVGRPSCTGGTPHLVALVRMQKPNNVVIVADADKPGIHGANRLASVLALHCRDVRTICPPTDCKDMRDWVANGVTRTNVEQHIHDADVRRLKFTGKGAT